MITSLFAVPLAILYLILSGRVITYRRGQKIGLGDEGDKSLLKRMRAHANFAEYVPFGLVMMLLAELQGAGPIVLGLIGGLLLLGRALHAYGFSASPPKMALRVRGMLMTFGSIIVSAVTILALALLGS